MSGWIGVDFDGTLATYGSWAGATHVGEPIKPMVDRVKKWLDEGREVRIFTARCYPISRTDANEELQPSDYKRGLFSGRWCDAAAAIVAIQQWCETHLGQRLTVTCVKDYGMIELYDDRAVQVRMNTGELVGESTRGL